MTSVFSARRRAEEFDSLVEDTSAGAPSRDARSPTSSIVAAPRASRSRAPPDSSPRCASELMAAADTLLLPADDTRDSPSRPATARDRRIAAVVGGFAIVGAATSLAVAAPSALPGEMLYPLKRAMENAETGVARATRARAPRCSPTPPTGSTRSASSAARAS